MRAITPGGPFEPEAAWKELAAEARAKPWLLAMLNRYGSRLYAPFLANYRRLRGQPAHSTRRLKRRLGLGLAGAALVLALAGMGIGPRQAFANSITVDGATCDLIEAIANANDTATGQPKTDCAAGDPTGADTIVLNADVTLTAPDNDTYGYTGLPVITSEITLSGQGHTTSRSAGAQLPFRVMAVGSGGALTLESATVSGGIAGNIVSSQAGGPSPAEEGGGILTLGDLAVANSTISGNSATAGGGLGAYGVSMSVSNSLISGNTAGGYGGGMFTFYSSAIL